MNTASTHRARVILAGGSGFLGRSLASALLSKGYQPVILTRSPDNRAGEVPRVHWDGKTLGAWTHQFDGAAAVVNLTGRSVNCRYTPGDRREIIASRVDSVRAIAQAIRQCAQPPRVWVQAGSTAIYGDTADRWCGETTPAGKGFPVETCLRWEEAFDTADVPGTRRALFRISFALGAVEGELGGALKTLAGLVRWGLGGAIGSGKQYVSWIHVADLNRMFLSAIEHEDIRGVYNATGLNPLPNEQFMRVLRHALGRPWSPRVPAWAAHIGSWLMRTEASLALTGRRCSPARFLKQGFEFEFPHLAQALADIFTPQSRKASAKRPNPMMSTLRYESNAQNSETPPPVSATPHRTHRRRFTEAPLQ